MALDDFSWTDPLRYANWETDRVIGEELYKNILSSILAIFVTILLFLGRSVGQVAGQRATWRECCWKYNLHIHPHVRRLVGLSVIISYQGLIPYTFFLDDGWIAISLKLNELPILLKIILSFFMHTFLCAYNHRSKMWKRENLKCETLLHLLSYLFLLFVVSWVKRWQLISWGRGT